MRPLTNEEYENFHEHVKCPWITCVFGIGLAGRGDCCAGDWSQKDCLEFTTEEAFLEKWKAKE